MSCCDMREHKNIRKVSAHFTLFSYIISHLNWTPVVFGWQKFTLNDTTCLYYTKTFSFPIVLKFKFINILCTYYNSVVPPFLIYSNMKWNLQNNVWVYFKITLNFMQYKCKQYNYTEKSASAKFCIWIKICVSIFVISS